MSDQRGDAAPGRPRDAFSEWEGRFGGAGGAALRQLQDAKADHGAVTSEDLRHVAADLRRPVAGVTGAASFYADLTGAERARRDVRVCDGTSCFVSSGGDPVTPVERAVGVSCGARAADGSVSLDRVFCLGYCYASPALLDGPVARAGPGRADRLGSGAGPAPPAIPYQSASSRSVLLAGLLGQEEPWQAWPQAVSGGVPREVIDEVRAAGLRGRGGAEFPVAAKWEAAAGGAPPRYVVANGDEGDPGSFCDRLLMEGDPHRVLEGLALAGFATGARQGFVFVRSEYPAAVARMRAAVAEARAGGQLGRDVHGSGVDFDVEVVEGAGSYVAGEETALVHALEGMRGNARARPPFPTTHGLAQRPTAVNNVETLTAVPWILHHGGTAYARLGTPPETGTKLVCLSERFRRPGVYEVEFGIPLRAIGEELGGGLRDGRSLRAVQIGGPLGGFLAPDELGLPLLASALADAGVALGHGSLVAIDQGVTAEALLRHVWEFAAAESCGACAPCRVGTRRGLDLLDRDAPPSTVDRLLEVMAVGSLCAFGRSVPGAVRSLPRVFRDELGRAGGRGGDAPDTGRRDED